MRLAVILFLVAALSAYSAYGALPTTAPLIETDQECKTGMSWDIWRKRAGEADMVLLAPARREKVINQYNAIPPASQFTAPEVYIYGARRGVVILFVAGKCVLHADIINPAVFNSWITDEAA